MPRRDPGHEHEHEPEHQSILARALEAGNTGNERGSRELLDQIARDRDRMQAADMLNVSRPYLIGLLESGKIPYRRVGRHRRIRFEALREYKRHDDLERRAAADDLADLSQELGLY